MQLPKELLQQHHMFTGVDALSIDLANQYGLDKETWEDRLLWTAIHEHELGAMTEQAESPLLYRKALHAYNMSQQGLSTGHNMFLDACNSGAQIYAVLTGCKTTAANCGLINTDVRRDAYTQITRSMEALLGGNLPYTRDQIKAGVMTSLYNSRAEPVKLCGDGTPELKAFYVSMHKELPGAMMALNTINAHWDPSALYHSWTLPDNWQTSPLKPCYNAKVQTLKEELACLKKLAKEGIAEV